MRHKISSNQFIEHLEIGGHYYGLSINTVRSIANQAKTALITVAPRVSATPLEPHPQYDMHNTL